MNKNTALINISFILALIVSIFAIKQLLLSTESPTMKDNPHTPDYYMLNVTYMRTNDLGRKDILVFSPVVHHFQEQDRAEIQTPIIKLYKKDQEVIATSKRAKSFNGTERFELYEDVVVRQTATQDKPESVMLTESLTAFPKKDLVTTNEKVTIKQPGLDVTGIGMKGDLKNGNIQLLSQTKGHYDPKKCR